MRLDSHPYNEHEWPIVRRIIHSTADFDFARDNKVIFHKNRCTKWFRCTEERM